jgi:hypothetical protein
VIGSHVALFSKEQRAKRLDALIRDVRIFEAQVNAISDPAIRTEFLERIRRHLAELTSQRERT